MAVSTPGQALPESLGVFGPTREGLIDGALQLVRLLATLAALAILLDRLQERGLVQRARGADVEAVIRPEAVTTIHAAKAAGRNRVCLA